MAEGRTFVYPQAIGFGARPVDMPGRGAVLCASAFFAFRLSDGQPVRPAEWYQAVSLHGGANAIPDTMAPLPGAELLVLGATPPVEGREREAFVSCGSILKHFTLYPDPDAPGAPVVADATAAIWHREANPVGRGGPDDNRAPLILDRQDAQSPLWLGPTPFDHPARLRLVGIPDEKSGAGWPSEADPKVFHDAHEAFRGEALYAGEPLASEGVLAGPCIDRLPPYRISITSGRMDERWVTESARLHSVMLIPEADLAAMIWRTAIDLGDDVLGESVIALIAALEDAQTAPKDEMHWAAIAIERWGDPARALDDRPLLPAALAAAVTLPFAPPPGGDPIEGRIDAAREWMQGETGLPDDNPFAEAMSKEGGVGDEMREAALGGEEELPDVNDIGDMATAALARAKRRHEEAGFPEPDLDKAREPSPRGPELEQEIAKRLRAPYQARQELEIVRQISAAEHELAPDPGEILNRLAEARRQSPNPPLLWPAMTEPEAAEFGSAAASRLATADPERHIDISGAAVTERASFTGRRFHGLLAEETLWRDSTFINCHFSETSFAGSSFENCTFDDCTFEHVNLSRTTFQGNRFARCIFRDLQSTEPVWMESEFLHCELERVTLMDVALRALQFEQGQWSEVQLTEGLAVEMTLRGTNMREVTFSSVHAPHAHFDRTSMFKFWALSRGFPGSTFEHVEGKTCGFLSECYFNESRLIGSRFVETGFSGASFAEVKMEEGCEFESCDLSGAIFAKTDLPRTRFTRCSMATSIWQDSQAPEAWFFGSVLRGVNFGNTELARAVFADADLEGVKFDPDRTIGADFRGTILETA